MYGFAYAMRNEKLVSALILFPTINVKVLMLLEYIVE